MNRDKKHGNNNEMMLHFMLNETTCDTLTKMLISYVLNMPKGDKMYYEKINVVVEFLEECLPAHPGAFAAYYKILDLMPATTQRKVPVELFDFTEKNLVEIEKYYEGPLPDKYRPSKIIQRDKTLVDLQGNPIGVGALPRKLDLV